MHFDNNDSIFVFTKVVNIDKQEVGDKLSIDDINKQFSQSVDNVTIEDTEVEEKIGFDPVGIDPIENKVSSEVGIIFLIILILKLQSLTCSLLFIQVFQIFQMVIQLTFHLLTLSL